MIDALIQRTWDGRRAAASERVRVTVVRAPAGLVATVDAPFHDDPAPALPPGRADRLWEHEVVELFLVGHDGRYLELEVGPHGHWLALTLSAPRVVEADDHRLEVAVRRAGGRWRATVLVPDAIVPPRVVRWNAFAIHGTKDGRRWLAAAPTGGDRPDFHRPDAFPELTTGQRGP